MIQLSVSDEAALQQAYTVISRLLSGAGMPARAPGTDAARKQGNSRAKQTKRACKRQLVLTMAEQLGDNFLKYIDLK